MTASPLLNALRASTQDIHRRLEHRLILSSPDAGADAYRRYLEALYGWLAPFEAALWSAPWPASIHPARRDGKRHWIEQDLRAFGLSDEALGALPRCPAVPSVATAAERVGVAYVVEGSQLGGQVLLRQLSPALAPRVPRYLVGYGADTGTLWKTFLQALFEETDDAQTAVAAEAARAAFTGLHDWFIARGAA